MYCHLIPVKVCIKCCAYQRVKLDRLTFYQNRLKCLNTQSVKCRCTVQHNRMLFNYILQHIPYFLLYPVNHLLCTLNIMCCLIGNQFFHNKRLKQLNRHLFWKSTLIDLKLRSHNDNRTTRIINTLSKQILTETSLLALKHI